MVIRNYYDQTGNPWRDTYAHKDLNQISLLTVPFILHLSASLLVANPLILLYYTITAIGLLQQFQCTVILQMIMEKNRFKI